MSRISHRLFIAAADRARNAGYARAERQLYHILWIEKVPGVNCQEKTKEELLESLRETLRGAIEFNRQDAITAAVSDYVEEPVTT